jgi:hypothetical protein
MAKPKTVDGRRIIQKIDFCRRKMNPRGSENLFRLRHANHKPNLVWVDYGLGRAIDWIGLGIGPTLRVLPDDPIARLDLRCCVGLDVIIEPANWDDKAAELYERLQEYAATITVVSLCFEPEMGWCWDRHYGRLELGQLQWIEKYKQAQSDCTRATGEKYKAAKAREDSIYRENPWL